MNTKIIIAILAVGLFTNSMIHAQDKTDNNGNHNHMNTEQKIYTCSMHPEVKSDKPGECPKCGMELVEMKEKHQNMNEIYTCSMHPEVKSDKPGECPECGMVLVKKKMDMKEDSNVKEIEQKEHKH